MFTPRQIKVLPIAEVPVGDLRYCSEPQLPVVLVVHGETVVADSLAIVLSRAGFATMTAYDGKSALELALLVPPEILVSDVEISGMNGIDLAMSVVNAMPECKILLFASYVASAELMHARASGYEFSCLTKPVHPTEVLEQVMECLKVPEVEVASLV